MTPAEYFASKRNLPTEMRTAELSALPRQIRERAFFMAAVSEGEILQIFRDVTAQAIEGKVGLTDARRMLREKLAAVGYAPRKGEEGTIHDLTSVRRQNVVLETNMAMAGNYASEVKQTLAARAFPAKELVRLQQKKVPRHWEILWREAYDQLTAEEKKGVSLNPAVALLGHRIWLLISDFGNPYAPFKFNSGMGTKAKGRTETKALGIDLLPLPRSLETAAADDFNETLQATPAITDADLRENVTKRLDGLAAWEGDTLLFLTAEARLARKLASLNPELTPAQIEQAVVDIGKHPIVEQGMVRVEMDGAEFWLNWKEGD